MKRLSKCLLVLLVTPLMSGCSGKMKAPEFASYGDKHTWTEFNEAFLDARDGSAHRKEDLLKSVEIQFNYKSTANSESKRNDRTVEIINSSSNLLQTQKYDSVNKLYDIDVITSSNYQVKSSYGKGSNSESEERKVMYQSGFVDGKLYVLSVDKTRKEYSKLAEIVEPLTVESVLDIGAKDGIAALVSRFMVNIPSQAESEAEDSKYSLYVNNKIFTVVYENEETEEFKNEEDVLQYTITTKEERIYQVDLFDYNWSYKSSVKSKVTKTYQLTYDTHIKGDTSVQESTSYENSYGVQKENKLKATDLRKYTRVAF